LNSINLTKPLLIALTSGGWAAQFTVDNSHQNTYAASYQGISEVDL